MIVEKHEDIQMNLFDTEEWILCTSPVKEGSVSCSSVVEVRQEWLSDCEKERVLTSQLLEEVTDASNLDRACRQVVSNRGSSGIDGMSYHDLSQWLSSHLSELQETLLSGSYTPEAVLGVSIPKASGGERLLGIPTVIDRLVQQAIHQVLSFHYEPTFSSFSYGFRPNRSAHDALKKGCEFIRTGSKWLVDIDLEKFFDTVSHDRLMWLLSRRIGDKRVLSLIHSFLRAGMMQGGCVSQRVSGTPQGSPLSPLLSNIVLDELDKELEKRGHDFVRYADDLRIFVGSKKSAQRVLGNITLFIEKSLKLKVNRSKSSVCPVWKTNFLGHSFLGDGSVGLSKMSEERFKKALKRITRRNRGISLEQLLKELNLKIRGWLSYFRYAQMKNKCKQLMGWLQRRIRCFRLKQCKKTIGIFRFLRKRGLSKNDCWKSACSRKGWWRRSMSPPIHIAMNQKWFTEIGLYNLFENYCKMLNT